MAESDSAFVGSVPDLYETHLAPAVMEPLARDLAARLPARARRVIEVAAGTGRLTRQLVARLPADGTLVATDLNAEMIAVGGRAADARVTWQVADAQALPFPDGEADVVACQLGLMFVPDKPCALREMRRVLRPGGTLLLNVMAPASESPWIVATQEVLVELFPGDPPQFYLVPFSMSDRTALEALIAGAGFRVTVETVRIESESPTAAGFARGLIRGNPVVHQIAARGGDVTVLEARVAERLASRLGDRPVRVPLAAHVVTALA